MALNALIKRGKILVQAGSGLSFCQGEVCRKHISSFFSHEFIPQFQATFTSADMQEETKQPEPQ